MLRRLRERFFGGGGGGNAKKGPTGPGGRGVSWPLVAAIIVLGWLATGFYVVNEGEQAVITRLGRFDRITGPGAHWRLPPPMEGAMTFNVTGQRSDEIGCERTNNRCADPEEGLMLTGDRNIVDVHFRVLYNIANVRDFAFNVRDPVDADRNDDNQGAVRQVVESAMREVVGRRQLEQIITTDRGAVEEDVHRLAQQVLNDYQVGVRVLQVQLLTATVPPDVIAAFNDVIIANQDAETATNNANRDSSRLLNTAQAYKEQVVREATGETQRFLSVYNEYRLNPQVTRDRLYLETMERVYASNNLVILDSRGGAVPYLPLDMLRRNNAAPAAPPAQGAH
jgi:membrane protease subunit HflK